MSQLGIGDTIRVAIRKCDPTRDEAPYYQSFEVPYTKEMRVLEALDYIVEELGESLAYQWFCGVKKCGMCGMVVNGRPTLACWEPVAPEMVVEPMANLPVLRDLVIDRTHYQRDLLRIMPLVHRVKEYPGFPEALTPDQMGHSIEMMQCIECLLCMSVCPAYNEGSRFVGPAPLVQLARVALDPRDEYPRAALAVKAADIQDCVSCYKCVEACPAGINVLEHAIDPLRRLIVGEDIGDIAHHNKTYRRLVEEAGIVNPSILILRSRGIRALAEVGLAIRLWLRGRLSATKILSGLVGRERLTSQDDLTHLATAIRDLEARYVTR